METGSILRVATVLLTMAFVSGLAMAAIRFASDKHSPPWLAKLHGFAAVAALTLLAFGWVNLTVSSAASFGLVALLVAAAIGLFLNLAYHGRRKPLPEGLVFAHMAIAFVGCLVVGMVLLSLPA